MTKVWAEMGHEVTVISGMYNLATGEKFPWCRGKLICKEDYSKQIEVYRVYTSENYNKNFLCRAWAYFTVMFFGFWAAIFSAKGKFDAVLATSPPLTVGPVGVWVSKIKRCPFIFEVRDLWPESAIDTGVLCNPFLIKILYWMERFTYKHARIINALTPAFVEKLANEKGFPKDRIWMIPNAADLDVIRPGPINTEIRRKHGWDDKFVALYTGAHGRANHLWQLIDAAKVLKADPRFLIVCIGSGMERDALMHKVAEEKLSNIQFLPPVSKAEIGLYLNACDVTVIVLKKVDTFKTVYPNKMFDSMSAAKPIILAIDGAARELVVENARAGLYVEPENVDQIVEALKYYNENPEIKELQGQNGYHYVTAHYDRQVLSKRYIESIGKMIQGGSYVTDTTEK